MLYTLKKLYRPEYFQGDWVLRRHRRRPRRERPADAGGVPAGRRGGVRGRASGGLQAGYFEGWYFKSAFPDQAWSIIPGLSLAAGDPHCFVQVLDGKSGLAGYHRYPAEEFSFAAERFEVRVGPNRFCLDGVHLELDGLPADLRVRDTVRWPSALFSPSSMGWYAFARFMECYHGVIVLDGEVEGVVGDQRLSGGRFYLEKDWGSSFPRAWVWAQSNSFDAGKRASLTCSIARVPFRGREFSGFIIGLLAEGCLRRFTTYTGAVIESFTVGEASLEIRVRRGRERLRITAAREAGAELASPVLGEMTGRIEETLGATLEVVLSEGGRTVFSGSGRWAGLEVVRAEELNQGEVSLR
jgi:tocopherol cyclase